MSVITDCSSLELIEVQKDGACTKGGVQAIYAIRGTDLDLAAVGYDPTGECITSLPTVGAAVWVPIAVDIQNTSVSSIKADGEALYTNLVTAQIAGRSKAKDRAINRLANVCPLVLYIVDRNCQSWVIGIQRNLSDDGWDYDDEGLEVINDGRSLGDPTTRSQYDISFRSRSLCASLGTTVDISALTV